MEKRHENIQKCHSTLAILQHSMHLYLMNNLCGSSVSDHIGSMDHHIVIEKFKSAAVNVGNLWYMYISYREKIILSIL